MSKWKNRMKNNYQLRNQRISLIAESIKSEKQENI